MATRSRPQCSKKDMPWWKREASEGVMTLKDLISRFPLSEEASLAQQKLKEIAE